MKKYIIREVEPDCVSFENYFDDDGLSAAGGDYCYTLFIVSCDRWGRYDGFNVEEFKNVCRSAENMAEQFDDIAGDGYYASWYSSYKACMIDSGISYNPRKCHALKELLRDWDNTPENVAAWLTITTGKEWAVSSANGYCQGDYVEMVYCPEHYKDGVQHYGEVWLGAAKEFCVIELDEAGEEIDSCYGYIVADCQAWRDEDYKRIVSEWAGISADEAQLEMIDGYTTRTVYSYRTA